MEKRLSESTSGICAMAVVAGFSYYGIYKLIHSNFISLGIAVVLGMAAYFIVYLAVSKHLMSSLHDARRSYLKKIAGKLPVLKLKIWYIDF